MRDRAKDWSERGRWPRGEWGEGSREEECFRPSSPFSARLCLSLAPVSQLLWTRKEMDTVQSNLVYNGHCAV